jgi:hypothetical protein
MTEHHTSAATEHVLDRIEQRLNESGTGEMGLLDTIHAVAAIVREARAGLRDPAQAASNPIVWRVRYCGQWLYFENKAHAEIYAQGDDNIEPLYAAQPPAAPVETDTKSAPVFKATQQAESEPSVTPACAGADTRCSAGTEVAELEAEISRLKLLGVEKDSEINRLRASAVTVATLAETIWNLDGPRYSGWPASGERVPLCYKEQYGADWKRCERIAAGIIATIAQPQEASK